MSRRLSILLSVALIALCAPWWASHQSVPRTPAQAAVIAAAELAEIPQEAPLNLIVEPDDGMGFVTQAIAAAQRSIDLTMYEMADRDIEEALAAAHRRGVSVRVILENINTFGRKPNQPAFDFLKAAGVPVKWAPEHFALSHQKTLVVDEARAYVMSFNFAAKYYPTSRDFGLIDADPVDIAAIKDAFEADWAGRESQAPRGKDLVWSPGAAEVLLGLIDSASSTLDVYALEMADYRITAALKDAAARGVRVRIIMTYDTDWKSALIELTRAGTSVRTFASSASVFIHAKVVLADGARAFVGSQNFSVPSLEENRELGVLLKKSGIIETLRGTFEHDWARARPYILPKEAAIIDASGAQAIVIPWRALSSS